MEIKIFEVRDKGTFIPMAAIRLCCDTSKEAYLLNAAGYGQSPERYVILIGLEPPLYASYSSFDTEMKFGSRTRAVIHKHLEKFWESCVSGDVLDVRYILGETQTPCVSQFSE